MNNEYYEEEVGRLRNEIQRLKQEKKAVERLGYWNPDLGLPNNFQLIADIEKMKQTDINILLVDIANLRKVNDAYGRKYGNELLKAVRDYIISLEVENSRLYRLETADFGLLIQGRVHTDDLRKLAQKVRDRSGTAWKLECDGHEYSVFVTLNIGVLPLGKHNELLPSEHPVAVEYTMDMAKKAGGIAVFDRKDIRSFFNRIKLEMNLRHAVKDNMKGFYIVYQPIVDANTYLWKSVEALCRWKDEDFGEISPAEFIKMAEISGLIGIIGEWVLETAVMHIKQLGLDEVEHFNLHVNFSPVQLDEPGFKEKITGILDRYDFAADKLCLEITESTEILFTKKLLRTLQGVERLGVCIAMDDFGVGYTSLSSLRKLPVKIIKVDKSLTQNIEKDEFLKQLFYIVKELAYVNDMKVIAEGVESAEQAQVLLEEGTDYYQGYLFSKPLTVTEIQKNNKKFVIPPERLVPLDYTYVNLRDLLNEPEKHCLPHQLYRLLGKCIQIIFNNRDQEESISAIMETVVKALDVSRFYIYRRKNDGTFSITHEWCSEGTRSLKVSSQHLDIEKLAPERIALLQQKGMMVAADVEMLEESTRSMLRERNIKAIAEFPLWQNGRLSGAVGVSDSKKRHYWTKQEVRMLYILGELVAGFLDQKGLRDELTLLDQRGRDLLNWMDILVYVTDPDTGYIYYASDPKGGKELEGGICWYELYESAERCEFCPVPYLKEHPEESVSQEVYYRRFKDYYRVTNKLIPWENGKQANLVYAFNITDIKKRQRKLEEVAVFDSLTHEYNREGFFTAAQDLMEKSFAANKKFTMAFVDIDGLKRENDIRGHSAGDRLICTILSHLRKNIRSTDLIGRYGGDEFLVLFYDCTAQIARRNIENTLKYIRQFDDPNQDLFHSFSYGLVENTEIPYRSGEGYLQAVIDMADLRMLELKKRRYKQLEFCRRV